MEERERGRGGRDGDERQAREGWVGGGWWAPPLRQPPPKTHAAAVAPCTRRRGRARESEQEEERGGDEKLSGSEAKTEYISIWVDSNEKWKKPERS